MSHFSAQSAAIWHHVVKQHQSGSDHDFAEAVNRFLGDDIDRIAILRHELRSRNRATALFLLARLPTTELQELFDELVYLASFSHGAVQVVRNAIRSLPRAWVLDRIESAAEPILTRGSDDEYRRLLELYTQLDHHAAEKLARRAIAHHDSDIREAGEDFLKQLGGSTGQTGTP